MGAQVRGDWPYVNGFRDRHGKMRYYFRRRGYERVALPGKPGAPEFIAAYQAALRVKPSSVTGPGSFEALCSAYLRSAEFKTLKPTTQRETRYVVEKLRSGRGDRPVKLLERKHILDWRDGMAGKPGAANKMLRVVKVLMTFAVDRGFRADDPSKGIKLLPAGRYRAWTDEELGQFETAHALGTLERTGYALALYTGQRRSDLVSLSWASIAGNAIRLTQRKTGTELEIHIHPKLKDALAAVHPRHEAAILTGEKGGALNAIYFGSIMADAIEKAGLPKACVLHGLRKTTARLLAESGSKVSSVTGHLSEQMEREYARDASQKKMAKAAIIKWARRRERIGKVKNQ